MRLQLILTVIGGVLAVSACSPKKEEASPKVGGIECDAKCQARIRASGTGDFPRVDTSVTPRKNGNIQENAGPSREKQKE